MFVMASDRKLKVQKMRSNKQKIVVASDVSIAEDPIDGAAPKKVILE